MYDSATIDQISRLTAAVVKRIAVKQKKEGAKHEKRNSAHRAN